METLQILVSHKQSQITGNIIGFPALMGAIPPLLLKVLVKNKCCKVLEELPHLIYGITQNDFIIDFSKFACKMYCIRHQIHYLEKTKFRNDLFVMGNEDLQKLPSTKDAFDFLFIFFLSK